MELAVLVVLHLVVFHAVDGHEISINPEQVTTLYAAKPDEPNKLLVEDVACVVGLTNGKFISVAERCDVVRRLLEESAR